MVSNRPKRIDPELYKELELLRIKQGLPESKRSVIHKMVARQLSLNSISVAKIKNEKKWNW